jgi:probable rRNA maturation factor
MDTDIQFLVEDDAWQDVLNTQEDVWRTLIEAALAHAPQRIESAAVSVVLTNDAAIKNLNASYRSKDKPTNVLSFPQIDGWDKPLTPLIPGESVEIGDIILAWGVITAESAEQNKSFADHAAHLLVHGTLHLLGYDHLDDVEAAEMEGLETAILTAHGLADPYVEL